MYTHECVINIKPTRIFKEYCKFKAKKTEEKF